MLAFMALPDNALAGGSGPGISPDEVVARLQQGNERFVSGQSTHQHTDAARLFQAGTKN
jgi:hypothetical protein